MCLAACLVPACPPSSQELDARELVVVKASKYYKRETRAIQERYQELTKEKVRHRPSMQRAMVWEGRVTNCYFMHIHSSTAASLMEDACAYTCFCLHALVCLSSSFYDTRKCGRHRCSWWTRSRPGCVCCEASSTTPIARAKRSYDPLRARWIALLSKFGRKGATASGNFTPRIRHAGNSPRRQ